MAEIWLEILDANAIVSETLAKDSQINVQIVGTVVLAEVVTLNLKQGDLFTRKFKPVPPIYVIDSEDFLIQSYDKKVIDPDAINSIICYFEDTGISEIKLSAECKFVKQVPEPKYQGDDGEEE